MSRINTNVLSLAAQQTLSKSQNQLQNTLNRLSTGLRINSGKDDPAGLIAAAALGSNIASTQQAISNSQTANQMISTADSALGQVSTLLTTVRGLVTQAANTGALNSDQIAANQLQIDSSLDAINRIAQTTTFQGKNLLNGSLGFLVGAGTGYAQNVASLQVNQVNMESAATMPVSINVTTAASQASLTNTMANGTKSSASLTFSAGAITVTAPTVGTDYNNVQFQVKESAGVAAGTAQAAYDSTNRILTVTVNNTGTTKTSVMAQAIQSQTSFTATVTGLATDVYTAGGTDHPAVNANTGTNITTTGGGVLKVSAKDATSAWNTTNITFATNGTSATPQVSYVPGSGANGAGGTLVVQVQANATTNLQAITDAINNSTDANVQKFSASVTTAGSLDATVDGPSTVAGAFATQNMTLGGMTLTVTANNKGTAYNNLLVHVVSGSVSGGAKVGAAFDATANSGNGQLTLTFAASQTNVGAADITQAIANLTGNTVAAANAFKSNFAVSASGTMNTGASAPVAGTTASATASGYVNNTTASSATLNWSGGGNTLRLAATNSDNTTDHDGFKIVLTEGASGTTQTTATYTQASNGGKGQLDITLANNHAVTLSEIQTALSNMTNSATFASDNWSIVATQTAGTGGIQTANTNPADVSTAGGTNHITGLNTTLTGATAGAVDFSSGTGSSALTGALVVQLGSAIGKQVFSFISGTTISQIVSAVNQVSDSIGVSASIDSTGKLKLTSQEYGSEATVDVNVISDAGTFATNLSATHAQGTDIAATINNIAATGKGNTVSLNTPNLSLSATLNAGTAAGTTVSFNINGGGALFQLGAEVMGSQQARLGIQAVDTANLGGTAGRLYELGSGQDAALATNAAKASKIIDQVASQVTSLRGRLGAFQKATVDTNIASLTDAVTNLTAAQSSIQDADFATESSNLTRAQILVQSGTSVLSIANKNPENVLALLR